MGRCDQHLCVCDNEGMLVGIITRKDLMTFEIVEKIKLHKAEAMLRGWAHRWKIQQRIKARERRRAEGEGQREGGLLAAGLGSSLPGTPRGGAAKS